MIIHGPNIHHGGGKVLLQAILSDFEKNRMTTNERILIQLDQRFPLTTTQLPSNIQIRRFNPSLLGRAHAELSLMFNTSKNECVLCFGNLPPLLPNRGQVRLFFQNTLLLMHTPLKGFNFKTKIRILIERLWLKSRVTAVQKAYVQSPTTAKEFSVQYPEIKTNIFPFAQHISTSNSEQKSKIYDFIYIASGDAHKNHINLLSAWELLHQEHLTPSLCLSVNTKYSSLIERINKLKAKGVQITNLSNEPSHENVLELFQQSQCLIYPSLTESFGLPLYEANQFGLGILASNRDYVFEVVTPNDVFDPLDPISISDSIKRHLKNNYPVTKLNSGKIKISKPFEFIQEVLK